MSISSPKYRKSWFLAKKKTKQKNKQAKKKKTLEKFTNQWNKSKQPIQLVKAPSLMPNL